MANQLLHNTGSTVRINSSVAAKKRLIKEVQCLCKMAKSMTVDTFLYMEDNGMGGDVAERVEKEQ